MKLLLLFSIVLLMLIPINAFAFNLPTQIIKLTGNIPSGIEDIDFILPSEITNQNKTIIFMSVRHTGDGNAKEVYRSWDFVNNTAIRFHGSSDSPASNFAMDFVAYLVEFTKDSTMIVQNGTLIVDGADVNQEFKATLFPSVNTTNSFQIFSGLTMDHTDLSWGSEEFGIMRVVNDTRWGYEPFDAPNTGDTEVRFSVIDWNDTGFIIQNGTGSLIDGEGLDTIVPSPSIDRNHTIVLISTQIEDELDASTDEHGVTATINVSNEIEIEREDSGCPSPPDPCQVNYRWDLISFPTTFANVTHGLITETNSTSSNVKQTEFSILASPVDLNRSIVIGTVHTPLGLGQSRASGGGLGSWDRASWTLELFNTTAVRAITNDGQEDSFLTFQVIEFLDLAEDLIINATDIANAVDTAINFDIFKLIGDISTIGDTVILTVTTDFIQNQTDIVITSDNVLLNITKLFQDSVPSSDNVIISKMATLLINATENTVQALDSVFILVQQIPVAPPTGGGSTAPASSGGSPVRLVGLSVGSEVISVLPASEVPSDFQITWFGLESEDVTLVSITPFEGFQQFDSWFQYTTPELLNIQTTEGFENRFATDPRSNLHQATNDFKVIAPRNACVGELENEITSLCLNPILYNIDLEFVFNVKGAEFKQIHTIQIDARTPEICDIICQITLFLMENAIALLAMAIVFVFIMGILKRKRRKVRTVHIIRSRDIDTLGNSRTARKFKNLKKK